MTKQDDGGAAFPINTLNVPFSDADAPEYRGMTLRDYFAARAMPLAMEDYRRATCRHGEELSEWSANGDLSNVAHQAYTLADAMLAARSAR